MPNLHIIIGDSNTRKSSLLRCLTGVGTGNTRKYRQVTEVSGNIITVYCELSALQEPRNRELPREFINRIFALVPQPTDILFTLWVSSSGQYPGFNEYLDAFREVGWPIINVALLGPSACNQEARIQGPRVCSVRLSPNQPTNQTASEVRAVWQWM